MSSGAIRALVSGYPRRMWGQKLLVMLQAYIDDSQGKSGGRPLVLAAYVHSAEEWIAFSDAWDAALREDPAIGYFKMVEAQNLRGEFKGWSHGKRTKKLLRLAEVIGEFGPLSLDCRLSVSSHKTLLKPHAPYGLASPYYPLVFALVCGVARACYAYGAHVPIDFIFDKQDNVSKQVLLFWDYTIDQQPKEWAKLINPSPIFRDDKEILPLQAADMLAWHTRRDYEDTYPAEYDCLRDLIRAPGFSYSVEITDDYLSKWGDGMRKIVDNQAVLTKKSWNDAIERIVADAEGGFPSAQHREAIERLVRRAG